MTELALWMQVKRFKMCVVTNGSFTLSDAETETYTDKMCKEPMEICNSVGIGSAQTLPNIIIEPNCISLDLVVLQCEYTIS